MGPFYLKGRSVLDQQCLHVQETHLFVFFTDINKRPTWNMEGGKSNPAGRRRRSTGLQVLSRSDSSVHFLFILRLWHSPSSKVVDQTCFITISIDVPNVCLLTLTSQSWSTHTQSQAMVGSRLLQSRTRHPSMSSDT